METPLRAKATVPALAPWATPLLELETQDFFKILLPYPFL